jgi:hypothetical protein
VSGAWWRYFVNSRRKSDISGAANRVQQQITNLIFISAMSWLMDVLLVWAPMANGLAANEQPTQIARSTHENTK